MQKSIGSKRTALARSNGKLRSNSIKRHYPYFVACIDNEGFEISLLVGKIYQVIKPERGHSMSWIRVIDEEGEDYLYPPDLFIEVDVPSRVKEAVRNAVII